MSRPCEICESKRARGKAPSGGGRIRRIVIEQRIVAMCDEHAREAKESCVRTLEALRRLFPEPGGDRSMLGRRSPIDRRIFPPRPEGRRRAGGRRGADASAQ